MSERKLSEDTVEETKETIVSVSSGSHYDFGLPWTRSRDRSPVTERFDRVLLSVMKTVIIVMLLTVNKDETPTVFRSCV